jgi:GT2 family glycosyltransferase
VGHGGNQQTKEHQGRQWHYRRSANYREETAPGEIWHGHHYWCRWTLPAGHLRFASEPATPTSREVVAVIPGRGLPEMTADCLRHLMASTISKDLRVVYVEDGPEPDWQRGAYHEIRRLVANIGGQVQSLGQPDGYTAATNAGIELAQKHHPGGHVLLLNNDAQVGARCLERMRWHLERHKRAAAVGPLTGDHGRQSVRQDIIKKASRIKRPELNAQEGDAAALRPLVWEFDKLSGFCLLLHADALEELGPLAVDGYPLGLGTDDEWIRRANRAGWRTFLAFDAWASHQHHQTFKTLGLMTERRQASGQAHQKLRRT